MMDVKIINPFLAAAVHVLKTMAQVVTPNQESRFSRRMILLLEMFPRSSASPALPKGLWP
jgi:CheY-specific phosphatase CheX